jgi:nucleoside-diphosphate-sugar epimerase
MKIIILGARGQIGSLLFNSLRTHHEVIGTSRKSSDGYIVFDPFRDDWVALGQADVLINCIGQIEATASMGYQKIHIGLAELILKNIKSLGNPRIVQISALGASANHPVEFLRTKGIADDRLLRHPNIIVIRPSIVCSTNTMIIQKMRLLIKIARITRLLVIPKGFLETKIQPILPQDLVDIVQHCLVENQLTILPAVGPDPLSFHEILDMMMNKSEKRFRIVKMSRTVFDPLVMHIIRRILPHLINSQQYRLLFEDNIADVTPSQHLLKRPLNSTIPFFTNAL